MAKKIKYNQKAVLLAVPNIKVLFEYVDTSHQSNYKPYSTTNSIKALRMATERQYAACVVYSSLGESFLGKLTEHFAKKQTRLAIITEEESETSRLTLALQSQEKPITIVDRAKFDFAGFLRS